MAHRIQQALACLAAGGDRRETTELLRSLGDGDVNSAGSSYTMLRVMIWAIPIIGFIGTVMGLGGAVGGFAGSLDRASDLSTLKTSLNGVTSGLSIAFDATFAALAISLVIMFPASLLEKTEMDLLVAVDDRCTRNLVMRLREPDRRGSELEESVNRAVKLAVEPHLAVLEEWRVLVADAGERMIRGVAEKWERHERARHDHDTKQMAALREESEKTRVQGREEMLAVIEQLRAINEQLAEAARTAAQSLTTEVEATRALVRDHAKLVSDADRNLAEALVRVEEQLHRQVESAGAAWDRAAGQQVARIAALAEGAQTDLRASQEALGRVAERFAATLEHGT